MIKVVLDTNILVSALINPYGSSCNIVNLVLRGDILLCWDNRLMQEYRQVLKRDKFSFDPQSIDDVLDFIEAEGQEVSPKSLGIKLPDMSDIKFLEVAVESSATYLITGNLKHYPLNPPKGLKIVVPARFLEIF